MADRRNDIGWKFTVGIMVFVVTGCLTIFFNHTYGMSKSAKDEATQNTIINTRQEVEIKGMNEKLVDLKVGQNEIKKILLTR